MGEHPELGIQESILHPSWPLGTPFLFGHPRGFMNCSWPPEALPNLLAQDTGPSVASVPFQAAHPHQLPHAHSSKQPEFRSRLTDRREENILWNLYVFIVDFAQPGAPRRFLALQALGLGDALGRFLPASSYDGALNHLGEWEAIGVAQECPSCGGEGGEDSGFPRPSAIGAFFSL